MTNSERSLRNTPRIFDDDRQMYEKAYKDGNTLVKASVTLDTQILELKNLLYQYKDSELQTNISSRDELTQNVNAIFMQAMHGLSESNKSGRGSWNDYFRLAMQAEMIDERMQADLAFMAYDHFDYRRKLVNGAAGKNIGVVELILATIDNLYDDQDVAVSRNKDIDTRLYENRFAGEINQLRGAMSESVVMALANYSQAPSKLALPARTYGDLRQKTDMIYFYADDKEKRSFTVPVQIKTSRGSQSKPNIDPENGFTLYMNDYDSSNDFRLARLLVAQHEPRELTEGEQAYLNQTLVAFDKDIKQQCAMNPGTPLPVFYK